MGKRRVSGQVCRRRQILGGAGALAVRLRVDWEEIVNVVALPQPGGCKCGSDPLSNLMTVLAEISAKSALAEVIRYMMGHWDGLTAVIEDVRIEVDTNTVERTMRSIGLGRKNSLYAGSVDGGRSWAILSPLVNKAKPNGLDPFIYLADVLEQMVSGRVTTNRLGELLPWSWKAAPDLEVEAV